MGTFAEPAEQIATTYARAAQRADIVVDRAQIVERLQRSIAAAPPLTAPRVQVERRQDWARQWWRQRIAETLDVAPTALPDAVFDTLWAHFAAARAWRLRPGVQSLLHTLDRRKIANWILSNNDQRLHDLAAALAPEIGRDRIRTSLDLGVAKPDPRAFDAVLREAGVPPQQAWLIDDAADNRAAARQLGMQAFAAPTAAARALTDTAQSFDARCGDALE